MQQMMNEPHRGYIQVPPLHAFDYNTNLHLSHVPSTSTTLLDTYKRKAWQPDGPTSGRCLKTTSAKTRLLERRSTGTRTFTTLLN
ncbi:glycoside hydrolase family 5 protein [Laccaria amethystina LaAM-08-1]|uniref:Glycoside hydrolase family 5 protein n=1 Tax=Laccaria amethystina LaAM-08-1 TaxID=1095629 RepID=A0A0C9XTQ2_9AGAR|nr:glycoside hydrolase family 5 protein [Laccaria amethystina LaAM-08-1]